VPVTAKQLSQRGDAGHRRAASSNSLKDPEVSRPAAVSLNANFH
jgi:hypothetical protein